MSRTVKIALFAVALALQSGGLALIIHNHLKMESEGQMCYLWVEFYDPYQPMLGKYLRLSSSLSRGIFSPDANEGLNTGDTVFLLLEKDEDGFISPGSLVRERPEDGLYLRATFRYTLGGEVFIKTGLNRFYIEEDFASEGEKILQEITLASRGQEDAESKAWVELRIFKGKAAMTELYVDGKPIVDLIKERAEQGTAVGEDAPADTADPATEDGGQEIVKPVTSNDLTERNGIYFERSSDIPFTGEVDGREQGYLRDGRRDGRWISYYPSGRPKEKGHYKDGKRNDSWETYHPNSRLASAGNYKDDKADGSWKFYYPNARLRVQGSYRDGKLEGSWEAWHYNGQPKSKGHYEDGKLEGAWKFYHRDGQLQEEGHYKSGKKEGLWKRYDEDGQLEEEGYFEDGEPTR